MLETTFRSPVKRWVGSKYNSVKDLNALLPKDTRRIIEPFAGSATFSLNNYEKYVILNDSNSQLINFYKVLQNNPHQLIKFLRVYEKLHSVQFYLDMRDDYKYKYRPNLEDWSLVDACRFLYFHYTCFNGLYRVNKSGHFNVPIGRNYNKKILEFKIDEKLLLEAHNRLTHFYLECLDFREVLQKSRFYFSPQRKDFVLLDPPYLNTFSDYNSSGFTTNDHIDLCNLVKSLHERGSYFVLFNSENDLYKNMLSDFSIRQVFRKGTINSKSSNRGRVKELIITNVF